MKHRHVNRRKREPTHRVFLAILGLMFIGMGASPLLRGRTHYQSYWGGAVFAPFVIVIGLLVLIGVFTIREKNR
jgi:hypothetical protein